MKKKLSSRGGRWFEFDPRRTALVLIDMQRDFIDEDGACGPCSDSSLVPRLQSVLGAARRAKLRIVHTRYGYKADLSDLRESARRHSKDAGVEYGSPGPLGRILVEGEGGFQFVKELRPRDGELVVTKTSFGAFATTDLETHLLRGSISHLLFAGVTANCCVESTLREAVDRGFYCCTLSDGTAASNRRLHHNTLDAIQADSNILGDVATCADFIRALSDALLPPTAETTTTTTEAKKKRLRSCSSESDLSTDDDHLSRDDDDDHLSRDDDHLSRDDDHLSRASSSFSDILLARVTPRSSVVEDFS